MEHTIIVRSENGEERVLTEHTECTSDDADLCDVPRELTLDELAAIDWLQTNLFKDLTLRGLGGGPILTEFDVTVVDGQVVEIVQTAGEPIPITAATTTTTTAPTTSSTTSTTTTTTTTTTHDDDDHDVAAAWSRAVARRRDRRGQQRLRRMW